MYRTNDPRFRRRLNDISQTLENANESAQSGLYIFGTNYVQPCWSSVSSCFTQCWDASCPAYAFNQQNRLLRRQRVRGRSRGRAELNFDFYDDWDEDEGDGLLVGGSWGNDEFDRLGGVGGGYGTVTTAQPARRGKGMSYQKGSGGGRRKSAHDGEQSGSGFLGRLFGGRTSLRYKPSAADLQEHPGSRRLGTDITEGEALLAENEDAARSRTHRRARSGTVESQDTSDSYSSRGDLFPSDEEDDAIPLDDEFAMVLERRITPTGAHSGPETESTGSQNASSRGRKRGKRPSAGSRTSTRRTTSSTQSGKNNRSRASSGAAQTPIALLDEEAEPSLAELKQEDKRVEQEEEADINRRRQDAQKLASERGLVEEANLASKEATPGNMASPAPTNEPSEVPTTIDNEHHETQSNREAQESATTITTKASDDTDRDTLT